MQLKVKLLKGGKEELVEVKDGSVSILELKTILQELFLIPVAEQSLVFRGRALLDARSVGSYGIANDAKLFLSHKTRGGATPAAGDPVSMETDGGRVVLTVKVLQGGREETIEVDSDQVTVAQVKKVLEGKCRIPSPQQSLVVGGRALEDTRRLCDYGIKSGDRLFLAQKSSPTPSSVAPPLQPSWSRKTQFYSRTQAYLAQHFTEDESELIVSKIEQDLRRRVREANLDSIEALAVRALREQSLT